MRLAVVGHVEWVEFAKVDRVPAGGEIAHATDAFEEPAGGGGVAAVQLARLGDRAELFTALGEDDYADRARKRLADLGVAVYPAVRPEPTRRALTWIEPSGERTITTIGERLAPRRDDPLPWESLDSADAVYFTAGDAGALRAARSARVLVATPRAGAVLNEAEVAIDALVFSDSDEAERAAAERLRAQPGLVVATQGAAGGRFVTAEGEEVFWGPEPPPGPIVDAYGAGDTFAAAFCWALAAGNDASEAARVAARAAALSMTGRGPYGRQLSV